MCAGCACSNRDKATADAIKFLTTERERDAFQQDPYTLRCIDAAIERLRTRGGESIFPILAWGRVQPDGRMNLVVWVVDYGYDISGIVVEGPNGVLSEQPFSWQQGDRLPIGETTVFRTLSMAIVSQAYRGASESWPNVPFARIPSTAIEGPLMLRLKTAKGVSDAIQVSIRAAATEPATRP